MAEYRRQRHEFTSAPETHTFKFIPAAPQLLTLSGGTPTSTFEVYTRPQNHDRWSLHEDFPFTGEKYEALIEAAIEIQVKVTALGSPSDSLPVSATLEDQSLDGLAIREGR